MVGKHARSPFKPSKTCTTAFLELVHTDLGGPMPVQTSHGKLYFIVILDDYTHVLDVHLLAHKD